MEPENDNDDDHELAEFEVFENLKKKDTYTPLTAENFKEWNQIFMKEVRSRQKREKKKVKTKIDMKKPSGKEIFQESANDLLFIGDEEEKEDVKVDEDLFDDDAGDLDELDF